MTAMTMGMKQLTAKELGYISGGSVVCDDLPKDTSTKEASILHVGAGDFDFGRLIGPIKRPTSGSSFWPID